MPRQGSGSSGGTSSAGRSTTQEPFVSPAQSVTDLEEILKVCGRQAWPPKGNAHHTGTNSPVPESTQLRAVRPLQQILTVSPAWHSKLLLNSLPQQLTFCQSPQQAFPSTPTVIENLVHSPRVRRHSHLVEPVKSFVVSQSTLSEAASKRGALSRQ